MSSLRALLRSGLLLASLTALSTAGCATSGTKEIATFSPPTRCCSHFDDRETKELVELVAKGEAGFMQLETLRTRGPAALDALIERLDGATAAEALHLRAAIDRVAAQRDADVSKLYWYTDLETAKHAAKAQKKPILSLRLLGRLDEDMSCANSRFFRTALYPDQKVSAALRERFILHWSTERPAPRLTIDFGDGRKVERTITGNSLHYVLDAEGRVLDAIPGLYGPQAFLAALGDAETIHGAVVQADPSDVEDTLKALHRSRADGLDERWRVEATQLGFFLEPPVPTRSPTPTRPPPAAVAMSLAAPKAMVEMPVLRQTKLGAVQSGPPRPPPAAGDLDALFDAMAERARPLAKLDATSRTLIARKRPMSWSDPNGPRPLQGAELEATLKKFEELMALDTVKNEYQFHARIHQWLAAEEMSLVELNEKVYDELFLTPKSDPWLGLVPPGAYTGLESDGLVK